MATGPVIFLQEARDELKKVTWPTKEEIVRLTGLVISISLIVGLYIGGLDFIFTKAVELFVK